MSQTTQTEITVAGMTCGHCSASVSEELSALPGVVAVAVDLHPGDGSPVTITSEAPLDPAAVAPPAGEAGPRLLPVRLPTPAAPLELVLPGGALLRIPTGCDPAWVRSLADALGGAPC